MLHRFEARLESSTRARALVILSGEADAYGIDTIRIAAGRGFDDIQVRVFGGPRCDRQMVRDACGQVEVQLAGLGRRGIRVRVTPA